MLQHVNPVCTARAGSQWDGTEEHQRRLDAEDVPFNGRAHRELREDEDVEARTQLPTVVMLPQSTTLQHPYPTSLHQSLHCRRQRNGAL